MSPRISSLFRVTLLASALPAIALGAPGKTEAKPAPAAPKDPNQQEIQVTLFGQPCLMTGPFAKPALTALHEISPEKIPPDLTADQMKKVRAKTTDVKSMPMPIEQYRDHLRKRLSAKIAFADAVAQAKKSKGGRKSVDAFLTNLKEHVSTLQYPGFAEATKKAFDAGGGAWSDSFVASARERYEAVIQPDTEEEFHKAIRTAKIQYVCTFDDGDHREDGSGEE